MFLLKKVYRVQSLRATNGSEAISLLNIGRLLRRFTPRKDGIFLITAVITIIIISAPALHACPSCGSALNGKIGQGFYLSILYMMAMPFVIFGCFAIGIVSVTRKNRTKAKVNQISR